MRVLLPCVFLLLLLSTFAAAVDFQPRSKSLGQLVFSRRSYTDESVSAKVKRSLPAWLSSANRHRIQRRSAEAGASCRALQGFETKLTLNTHRVGDRASRAHVTTPPHTSVGLGWWRVSREDEVQVWLLCRCPDTQARTITCRNRRGVSIAMESNSDKFFCRTNIVT